MRSESPSPICVYVREEEEEQEMPVLFASPSHSRSATAAHVDQRPRGLLGSFSLATIGNLRDLYGIVPVRNRAWVNTKVDSSPQPPVGRGTRCSERRERPAGIFAFTFEAAARGGSGEIARNPRHYDDLSSRRSKDPAIECERLVSLCGYLFTRAL